MLQILTDPAVLSAHRVDEVGRRQAAHARGDGRAALPRAHRHGRAHHGQVNRQTAEFLLAHGLGRWCEGVVFLADNDEKMILVKATGRALKLSQCGIAVEKRFAFYDQIHTTGMDIKHCLTARGGTLGRTWSSATWRRAPGCAASARGRRSSCS